MANIYKQALSAAKKIDAALSTPLFVSVEDERRGWPPDYVGFMECLAHELVRLAREEQLANPMRCKAPFDPMMLTDLIENLTREIDEAQRADGAEREAARTSHLRLVWDKDA